MNTFKLKHFRSLDGFWGFLVPVCFCFFLSFFQLFSHWLCCATDPCYRTLKQKIGVEVSSFKTRTVKGVFTPVVRFIWSKRGRKNDKTMTNRLTCYALNKQHHQDQHGDGQTLMKHFNTSHVCINVTKSSRRRNHYERYSLLDCKVMTYRWRHNEGVS